MLLIIPRRSEDAPRERTQLGWPASRPVYKCCRLGIRKDERSKTSRRVDSGTGGRETGNNILKEREVEMAIGQKEVAMRRDPRCSECDSEDPKMISLRSPAREHYCGRVCLYEGQKNFARWIWRTDAEAAS